MKNCVNCNAIIREEDRYCRNCGIKIPSKIYVIGCNLFSIFLSLTIFGFIILVIASYLIV